MPIRLLTRLRSWFGLGHAGDTAGASRAAAPAAPPPGRKRTRARTQRALIEEFEPRILYSAELTPLMNPALAPEADASALVRLLQASALPPSGEQSALVQARPRHEIIFVDAGVADAQTLIDSLLASRPQGTQVEVVQIRSDRDGLQQITDVLAGESGLDAVHIVSHGAAGQLQLGRGLVTAQTLAEQAGQLGRWGQAMGDDADLLLWGCEVGQAELGAYFVSRLASLTGADVAASTDLTGSNQAGGNWTLERQVGHIGTVASIDAQAMASWTHVLSLAVDATTSGTTLTTNFSLSHTTSGTDRLMLVGVSMHFDNGSVTALTYNGVSLSFVGARADALARSRVEIWAMVAPPTGTHSLAVTFASGRAGVVGAMTFTGVNQATPYGAFSSAQGNSATASLTGVASAAGEFVFGVVNHHQGTALTPTGTGQNEYWDRVAENANGGGTLQAGAASVNLSWSLSGSEKWAVGALAIKPANTAPMLDASKSPVLAALDEDAAAPVGAVGTLVSNLVDFALPAGQVDNITDPDADALLGIAVTGTDNINGSWWYSINAGSNWLSLGAVSDGSARLLAADAGTRLYFQPTANWNGTLASAITFRSWDQTSGSNGVLADASSNGGSTAFSAVFDTASLVVTAVNDAPTLGNGTLAAVIEDTVSPPGQLVSTIFSGQFADIDAGSSFGGIAVVANAAIAGTQGVWQYSSNGGTNWFAVGTVADGATALAVSSASLIRFVPVADYNGAPPALTVRGLDNSYVAGYSTTAGSEARVTVNTSTNGGTTAIAAATATLSTLITAVNDAPTISNGAVVALAGTNEDTANSATTVNSLLTSAAWADVDSAPLKGIAITAAVGSGGWQYSTDGLSWTGIGAVTSSNALLLTSTSQLRYLPDNANGETATFSFRAWDQTTDTASTNAAPAYANPGAGGGTSAYSSQLASASITVTSVNDAPVLSGANDLAAINRNPVSNPGTLVADLLAGQVSDVDAVVLQGIAVTAVVSTNGAWEYSTNGGSTWAAFGSPTTGAARLLAADASTYVRFAPNANYSGTVANGLTFRAWDRTSGTAGSTADTSSNGGSTAFSAAAASTNIVVTASNTAPTLSGANNLTAINEDPPANPGTLVSALIAGHVTDVDPGALAGVAVTAVDNTNGTWQYTLNGGGLWSNFGTPSGAAARLLPADANTSVRFVPNANWNGTATGGITFRAWDQTSGVSGGTANVNVAATVLDQFNSVSYSNNDGSQIWAGNWIEVGDNNGPSGGGIKVLASTLHVTAETTGYNIYREANLSGSSSASLSFAFDNTLSGSRVIEVQVSANGGSSYTTLAVFNASTNTGTGTRTFDISAYMASNTRVRLFITGGGSASDYVRFDNIQIAYMAAGGGGGSTAFSTAAASSSVTVNPVNDAPTISNGASVVLAGTNEDTTSSATTVNSLLTSAAWADVDTGALKGIAVTAIVANGTWQYSTDGLVWTDFGAVSASNALLLTSTTQLRFLPDAANGEAASFDFRAWDQTTGTASANGTPRYADPGMGGGSTAYSSQSAAAAMTVTSVNDAPVLAGSNNLNSINRNPVSNPGTQVAELIAGQASDVDTNALGGIAVTGVDNTNGVWQFSTNNGTSWTAFAAPSNAVARLLAADGSTYVRFVPNANWTGTVVAGLSYRAWDQTSGSAGGTANTSPSGSATAFSSGAASASIVVTASNTAPTLSGANSLTAINEDAVSNAGTLVSALVATRISDVDPSALVGIAVTGVDNANGNWQYTVNGGGLWTSFGSPSESAALLLAADASTLVRFVPNANWNGAVGNGITLRAWDRTSGTAGSTVNLVGASSVADNFNAISYAGNDGAANWTSPWVEVGDDGSVTSGDIKVEINNQNPTPTAPALKFKPGTAGAYIYRQLDLAGATSVTLSYVYYNSLGGSGQVNLEVSSNGGASWTALRSYMPAGAPGSESVDISAFAASNTQIRFFTATTGSSQIRIDDVAISYTGPLVGGTSAYSSAAASAGITVNAVNDAPARSAGTVANLTVLEDAVATSLGLGALAYGPGGGADEAAQTLTYTVTAVPSGTLGNVTLADGSTVVTASTNYSLAALQGMRFLPTANATGGPATFSWQVVDSGGTANGGVNTLNEFLSITVTPVNDAPTLGDGTLAAVNEDMASPTGQSITTIFSGQFADIDSGSSFGGMAIVGNSANATTQGVWQYSSNGGADWFAVGTVADGATALAVASTSLMRFVPVAEYNGTPPALTLRGLDDTYAGGFSTTAVSQTRVNIDTTTRGGSTAIALATATLSTSVTAVNDAPVALLGNVSLATVLEDSVNPPGATVGALFGASFSDAKDQVVGGSSAHNFAGIAVVANAANAGSQGVWQWYNGASWTTLSPAVSTASALSLTPTTPLRFLPNANFSGTPGALTVRLIDDSAGATINGATVNVGAGGGSSRYSGAADAVTLGTSITAVNDAPAGTDTTLTLAEDIVHVFATANFGFADLLDTPAHGLLAVHINSLPAAGSLTWFDGVSDVAVSAGQSISAVDISAGRLKFTPAADAFGAAYASFSFQVQDDGGTANGGVDLAPTANTLTLDVTPVNDAPVLDNSKTPVLAAIYEDAGPPSGAVGTLVSALVDFAMPAGQLDNVVDIDPGPLLGIAVTAADAGNGSWWYSNNNGGSWSALGAVSDSNARLLAADLGTRLYFQPNADWNGTLASAITFRAWDQSAGGNGALADTSVNGGSSAFSAATDTAAITVIAVNDAPTLGNAVLAAVAEDSVNPPGQSLATLFSSQFVDVDAGASFSGVAVVGNSADAITQGRWQYSGDGGGNWFDIGAVADGSTALALDANTLMRFVPVADYNGAPAALVLRGLDDTYAGGFSSTTGSEIRVNIDTTVSGGSSAVAAATATLSTMVTAVNDAPLINNGAVATLVGTDEDNASSGTTVDALLASVGWAEVDAGALKGIAVTRSSGNGGWQYSTDGVSWTGFGAVSPGNALLLGSTSQIRYVPDSANGEVAGFDFRAWDQTADTASANGLPRYSNPGPGGGTTAYSIATASALTTVASVNDAPVLANTALSLSVLEDAGSPVGAVGALLGSFTAGIGDVDSGAVKGVALVGSDESRGSWFFSRDGGAVWTPVGVVNAGASLLLADDGSTRLYFMPAADVAGASSGALTLRAWDQTSGLAGTKLSTASNGGSTAFSSATEGVDVLVTPVNDQPVRSAGGVNNLTVLEDAASTSLGLGALAYGPGGGVDELGQSISITVTAVPPNTLGSVTLADGLTVVGAGSSYSLAQLQGMRFSAAPNANGGPAIFSWQVVDSGGTANGGVDLLAESISITVTAVNDAPTRVAGTVANLTVAEDALPASLGLGALGYNASGLADEAAQTLSFTVTAVPSAALGTVTLADGLTVVSANSAYSLAQLQGMQFVAAADANGGPATFSWVVRDSGGTADGGVDTLAQSLTITVTPVNDAPVLASGPPLLLTTISEDDLANTGDTVAAILASAGGGRVSDVDASPLQGLAITGWQSGLGLWQYSTDAGANWLAMPAVSDNAALLLRSVDLLRLVPDGRNATQASLSFRAWDQTSGGPGQLADASLHGLSTAFSDGVGMASISVTAVNDAPTLGSASLAVVLEDASNPAGQSVGTLFGPQFFDIDDGASLAGVVVVGNGADPAVQGRWQYSSDSGVNWFDMGAVADDATALAIDSASLLRFLPARDFNGTPAPLTVRGLDNSHAGGFSSTVGATGTEVRVTSNASLNGGSTAVAATIASLSTSVTAVNDAPVLLGLAASPTFVENGAAVVLDAGVRVLDTELGVIDNFDGSALRLMRQGGAHAQDLFSASGSLGVLTEGGSLVVAGIPIGMVTTNSGGQLLLSFNSAATNQLVNAAMRQLAYANSADDPPGTVRIDWTLSDGNAGAQGLGGALSASGSSLVNITGVNDAPTLIDGAVLTLASTDEDTLSAPILVGSLLTGYGGASGYADIDGGPILSTAGIAVTGALGNGQWQFSTDGALWSAFIAIADDNALLLSPDSWVRYQPDGANGETASFSFKAWDQSSGIASAWGSPAFADARLDGGTTAFSSQMATAQILVSPVNDAPTLATGRVVHLPGTDEHTVSASVVVQAILGDAAWADIDQGSLQGLAVIGVSVQGQWQYSLDGQRWTDFGAVSRSQALLLDAGTQLRYLPDGLNGETASFEFVAWDQTSGTASAAGAPQRVSLPGPSGDSAWSAQSASVSILVDSVNDAPILGTGGTVSVDAMLSAGTLRVANLLDSGGRVDVDNNARRGLALTSAQGLGRWQYSTDGKVWRSVGAVGANNALLLDQGTQLRYLPNGADSETATLVFRAWDQSVGQASSNAAPSYVDPGAGGQMTAFSSMSRIASVSMRGDGAAQSSTPAAAPTSLEATDSLAEQLVKGETGASKAHRAQAVDIDNRVSPTDSAEGETPSSGAPSARSQGAGKSAAAQGRAQRGDAVSAQGTGNDDQANFDLAALGKADSDSIQAGLDALWKRPSGRLPADSLVEVEAPGDQAQLPGQSDDMPTVAAGAASVTLTAGLVWWLTRGGGMMFSVLVGVPAWRHVDLLPIVARSADSDDEDEPDDAGTDSSDNEFTLDGLFERQPV